MKSDQNNNGAKEELCTKRITITLSGVSVMSIFSLETGSEHRVDQLGNGASSLHADHENR